MIKTTAKIIALGLYWSCCLAISAQDGNVLVQIVHPDGSVVCCCPASRMTSRGLEWTDIYCAIPTKEYDQWVLDFSRRTTVESVASLHCAPGYTCQQKEDSK
jgi:hypothetical protein